MTTTSSTSSSIATDYASFNKASSSAGGTALTAQQQNDRFLKLLTTQLTNQDPLNPMDNAQMTSQMAQISTVSGIESLNSSIGKLSSQFVQMQALQGAALVGREVLVSGSRLDVGSENARGAFDLPSAADRVTVDVLNAGGQVVRSVDLGAQSSGQQEFSFGTGNLEANGQYTFKVSAYSGSTQLKPTALTIDKVTAVSANGGTLTVDLQHGGNVGYDTVKAMY